MCVCVCACVSTIKSELVLLSDCDIRLGDRSQILGLYRLKEWFKQLDPSTMIPLLDLVPIFIGTVSHSSPGMVSVEQFPK